MHNKDAEKVMGVEHPIEIVSKQFFRSMSVIRRPATAWVFGGTQFTTSYGSFTFNGCDADVETCGTWVLPKLESGFIRHDRHLVFCGRWPAANPIRRMNTNFITSMQVQIYRRNSCSFFPSFLLGLSASLALEAPLRSVPGRRLCPKLEPLLHDLCNDLEYS